MNNQEKVIETKCGMELKISEDGKVSVELNGFQMRQAFKERKFDYFFKELGLSNAYEEDDLEVLDEWFGQTIGVKKDSEVISNVLTRFSDLEALTDENIYKIKESFEGENLIYRRFFDALLITMYAGEVILENFSSAKWTDIDTGSAWVSVGWMMLSTLQNAYTIELTAAKGERVEINPLSYVIGLIDKNQVGISNIMSVISDYASTTKEERMIIEDDLSILDMAGLDDGNFYEEDIRKIEDFVLSWESKNSDITFAVLWRLASHIWALMEQEFEDAYSYETGEAITLSSSKGRRDEINIASYDETAIRNFREKRNDDGYEGVLLALDKNDEICLVFNPMAKLMYFNLVKKKGYLVEWYQNCKGLFE